MKRSAIIRIFAEARSNDFFRRVVFTGENSQLVVMCLEPYQDIGEETHRTVEQTIVVVDYGTVIIDEVEDYVMRGDAIVVVPGTRHNLIARGGPLRIFTSYSPPNHIDGTIHRTRADAEADEKDRAFGRSRGGY